MRSPIMISPITRPWRAKGAQMRWPPRSGNSLGCQRRSASAQGVWASSISTGAGWALKCASTRATSAGSGRVAAIFSGLSEVEATTWSRSPSSPASQMVAERA